VTEGRFLPICVFENVLSVAILVPNRLNVIGVLVAIIISGGGGGIALVFNCGSNRFKIL